MGAGSKKGDEGVVKRGRGRPRKGELVGGKNHYEGGAKQGWPKLAQMLKDLRHVYLEPEGSDRTEVQKRLREIWKTNPDKFLDRLERAEKEHLRRIERRVDRFEARKAAGAAAVDAGSEHVLGVIERVLREFHESGGDGGHGGKG